MRRARRLTIRRGLPGRARRRCEALLREVVARGGALVVEDHDLRAARRLDEAGLAAAFEARGGLIGRRGVAVFPAEADGLRVYPRQARMR